MKTNLASLGIDNITDEIFGMTAYVETNYHIASDEIDRIFDGNAIHCTEVKNSTPDDSKQLKQKRSRIDPTTVSTRFQDIQRYQNSSQR